MFKTGTLNETVILLLIITSTEGFQFKPDHYPQISSSGEKCNNLDESEENLHQFNGDVIYRQFADCHVTELLHFTPDGLSSPLNYLRGTPRVTINLAEEEKSNTTINSLNSESGRGQAKYQNQCFLYLLNFENFVPQDTQAFIKIFAHKESNKRAKYSFILISEYIRYESAKEFLQRPELKNYPHRAWTDIVPIDAQDPDESIPEAKGFMFHYFCYYCKFGQEGISTTGKIYEDAADITEVEDIFPDVTSNMMKRELRITAPPAPPLVSISPSRSNPKKNVIHGQQKNILESIAHKYNFSYYLFPSQQTGSKLPNGTWTGVMGEILYGRADIGLSVGTSYDRNAINDFTSSVFYAFLVLVSTKPIPVFEWEAIFYPFKDTAWVALIAATTMTFYLSKFFHNRSLEYELPHQKRWKSRFEMLAEKKRQLMTNFKTFYITVGSMLEQGVPFNIQPYPSRIYATFWMFFGMIVTCAYRSKLFSFLISPTIITPPSSFQELSTSDYSWGMKSLGGIGLLFITHSPLQYIRDVGSNMEIYTDKYTCLDKTFHGKFTCIIYKAYIDYMMQVRYWKVRHQFHVSDFVSPPVGSAWALAKYSPLQPNLDKMSFRIYEMGLADKYLIDSQTAIAKIFRALAQVSNSTDDIFALNANFKNDNDNGPQPLQMENLYGGFFILLFGVMVGFALLLTERIKHKKIIQTQRRVINAMRSRMKIFRRHNGKNQKLTFHQLVRIVVPEGPKNIL